MEDLRSLARNRRVLVASAGLGFGGFTLSMAFLPLYVRELGVTGERGIAIWTGLCFGITPLVAALISPYWARLAVRFGNKIMVERALVSFVIIMAITARIHDVRVLFLLRFLQGVFGGYAGMILSMIAASSPRSEIGKHIGTLQSVQTFSTAIGPLIGGLVAAGIGLRNTFYLTSVVYIFNVLFVHFGYREALEEGGAGGSNGAEKAAPVREIMKIPGFMTAFAVVFFIQYIDRSFGPVIPLYVAHLHGFGDRTAVLAGIILTGGSLAAAAASMWWGRRTLKQTPHGLIVTTTAMGALMSLAMMLSGGTTSLLVLRILLGLTAGGSMTLAFSWGGHVIPERIRTSSFSLLTSASLYAISVSPLMSGLLMAMGIKLVFLANALLYGIVTLFVLRFRRNNQEGGNKDQPPADVVM